MPSQTTFIQSASPVSYSAAGYHYSEVFSQININKLLLWPDIPISINANYNISFSALSLLVRWQEEHLSCEILGVHLLVVMIWLELCTSYSSSCHYHFYHQIYSSLASNKLANTGSPAKMAVKMEGAVMHQNNTLVN